MKTSLSVTLVIVASVVGFAQAPGTASIKMMDGTEVLGAIAGQVAFHQRIGTGGGLVAGADIEAISEKGLQIRAGASVLQTFLALSNRATLMKKPPHAFILQNAILKKPATPGMLGVSFEAPCELFGDSSCDKARVDLNLASGTNTQAVLLSVEHVLGEFRVQDGVGTIEPALTVTGPDGKAIKLDVTRIMPAKVAH